MKNDRKKRKYSPIAWQEQLLVPVLLGVILLGGIFSLLTVQNKRAAQTVTGQILEVIEARVARHDSYTADDRAKSLIRLLDKLTELRRCLGEEEHKDVRAFLDQYAYDQRLTGILVFDSDMNCVAQIGADGDSVDFLGDILGSGSVRDILRYPKKSYMAGLEREGRYYDFAAVSAAGGEGIVAAYVVRGEAVVGAYDQLLYTMFTRDSFDLSSAVAVTDSENVLATNLPELEGRSVEECRDFFVACSDESGLCEFKSTRTGERWYGSRSRYRGFNLYALSPESAVFRSRTTVLGYSAAVYILLWMVFASWRQGSERRSLRQLAKQYRIIASIGKLYQSGFLVHMGSGRAETIMIPASIADEFRGTLPLREAMDTLAQRYVTPAYREEHRAFTDLSTLEARLRAAPYLTLTYQDIYGSYIKAEILPQEYGSDGRLREVLILSRDVTLEKLREQHYQQRLIEAADEAERASMAKTDFLRRMSHDVRTPINGIRGMVEISRHYAGDEEKQEECRKKIMAASGFLLELVNSVLDMNKLESGELHPEEKPFDLKETLEDTETLISVQARERGLAFRAAPPECSHYALVGSPLYLRQILQNILGNAVKYNREGGSVEFSCRELSCDGHQAVYEFVCADTGIGMSEDFQKRAFEPFAQEDTGAHTSYSGTGLGLAITKELVEQMGGAISFVSRAGEGTTFTITLPLRLDENRTDSGGAQAGESVSLAGVRVLLVEDNDLNMEIARFLLEQQGARVDEAWNGREAVERFAASRPGEYDIILMDVMMPVMGGLDAARAIRQMDRPDAAAVLIFAMTANAFAEDVARCREAGMNAHLAKPLDRRLLLRTIRRYVGEKKNPPGQAPEGRG